MTNLSGITNEQREALRIVDAFTSAIAYAGLFGNDSTALAAEYIDKTLRDEEPEFYPVISAFIALLRRKAVEDCNGKAPGEEGYQRNR